jgi:hypothetical protein
VTTARGREAISRGNTGIAAASVQTTFACSEPSLVQEVSCPQRQTRFVCHELAWALPIRDRVPHPHSRALEASTVRRAWKIRRRHGRGGGVGSGLLRRPGTGGRKRANQLGGATASVRQRQRFGAGTTASASESASARIGCPVPHYPVQVFTAPSAGGPVTAAGDINDVPQVVPHDVFSYGRISGRPHRRRDCFAAAWSQRDPASKDREQPGPEMGWGCIVNPAGPPNPFLRRQLFRAFNGALPRHVLEDTG